MLNQGWTECKKGNRPSKRKVGGALNIRVGHAKGGNDHKKEKRSSRGAPGKRKKSGHPWKKIGESGGAKEMGRRKIKSVSWWSLGARANGVNKAVEKIKRSKKVGSGT